MFCIEYVFFIQHRFKVMSVMLVFENSALNTYFIQRRFKVVSLMLVSENSK
jgi:hypothetical protein